MIDPSELEKYVTDYDRATDSLVNLADKAAMFRLSTLGLRKEIDRLEQENQALRACLDGIFKYCLGKPGNELLAIRNTAAQALAPHAKKQDGGE
jgi:hypothetical protein